LYRDKKPFVENGGTIFINNSRFELKPIFKIGEFKKGSKGLS
jgi:hypothetical protein